MIRASVSCSTRSPSLRRPADLAMERGSPPPNGLQIASCGRNLRIAHVHQHGQSDELLVVEKVPVLTSWARLTHLP